MSETLVQPARHDFGHFPMRHAGGSVPEAGPSGAGLEHLGSIR